VPPGATTRPNQDWALDTVGKVVGEDSLGKGLQRCDLCEAAPP